ncbi:helix-turn-helix domain-containing protein [Trujillonella endophytica]|uniref:helix-turn-helix domain-containing protein n=1 Tax=Trujillonella endophytica TaxID=673521 RepID=UPI000B82AE70|nr:XRE family transcriptional regulator [Trujillella endophytica]
MAEGRGTGDDRLGRRIRDRRRSQGLTLVALAERAGLSQPFLSQLERGLAQPSMASLHRLARSLGTSTPALMAEAGTDADETRVSLVRAGTGTTVHHDGGSTRSLVEGRAGLLPLEFTVTNPEFDDYYSHAVAEVLYVLAGRIEVDLGGDGRHELGPADCLYYGGSVPHRFRLVGAGPARVLVVQPGGPPARTGPEN